MKKPVPGFQPSAQQLIAAWLQQPVYNAHPPFLSISIGKRGKCRPAHRKGLARQALPTRFLRYSATSTREKLCLSPLNSGACSKFPLQWISLHAKTANQHHSALFRRPTFLLERPLPLFLIRQARFGSIQAGFEV